MACRCADLHSFPNRRGLLAAAAGAVAAAALPRDGNAAGPTARSTIPPDEALRRLMEGHANYLANRMTMRDAAAERSGLVQGQAPIASILSCADSRVPPGLVFDQGAGDIFVMRVAGNVENTDTIASLEYGAAFLGVPLIMVLGHSGCGAVDAAIRVHRDNVRLPGHLPELIDQILPAVRRAEAQNPADLLAAAVAENVRQTMRAIASSQPVLAPLIQSGKVKLVGGVFDLASGRVTLL